MLTMKPMSMNIQPKAMDDPDSGEDYECEDLGIEEE